MQQSKHKNKTAKTLHMHQGKIPTLKQQTFYTKRGDEGNGKTALTKTAGSSSRRARSESRQLIDSRKGT